MAFLVVEEAVWLEGGEDAGLGLGWLQQGCLCCCMVGAGLSPRWLLHLPLLLLDGGLLVLLQWCFWWCFFVEDSTPILPSGSCGLHQLHH